MVNSKKMSKSTVAIVLLSLLLVLSLILTATGAWFTDSGKAGKNDQVLNVGKIGSVEVTATNYVWHRLDSEEQLSAETDKVMPGDYLKAGSVTITYTPVEGGDQVWYLIKDAEGNYYKVVDGALSKLAAAAAQDEGLTTLTVEGAFVQLDGQNLDGTKDTGAAIENGQGSTVTVKGSTYTIAIMQKTNVDAATALPVLEELIANAVAA